MVFPFPAPILGMNKGPVVPIIDDLEGTWTSSDTIPPGWSHSGGLDGGTQKYTSAMFSGSACLRAVATYDGDAWYYLRTWTKTAITLSGHNRMKLRRARSSGGTNNLTSDQNIKLNGTAITSGIVLSTTDTGVTSPAGGLNTWREYVVDISAWANGSLTLTIETASVGDTQWAYYDKFEFYGE